MFGPQLYKGIQKYRDYATTRKGSFWLILLNSKRLIFDAN